MTILELAFFQIDKRKKMLIGVTIISALIGVLTVYFPSTINPFFTIGLAGAFVFLLWLSIQPNQSLLGPGIVIFILSVLAPLIVPDVVPDTGRRDSLSLYYIVAFLLIMPIALKKILFLLKNPSYSIGGDSRTYAISMWIVAFYLLFSAFVGFINGNPITYILGDLLKPLIYVFIYYALYPLGKWDNKRLILHFWNGLFLAQTITFTSWLIYQPNRLSSSFWHINIALFAGSLSMILFNQNNWRAVVGLVLSIFVSIIMAYRTVPLLFLLSFILVFLGKYIFRVKAISNAKIFKLVLFVLLLTVGFGLYFLFNPEFLTTLNSRYTHAITSLDSDESLATRLAEAKLIFTLIKSKGLQGWLIGYGLGAQYLPNFISSLYSKFYGNGLVHNIHIFFVAVFFREGFLGIFVWIYFMFTMIRITIKNLKITSKTTGSTNNTIWNSVLVIWASLYLFMSILAATQFGLFDRDINLAVLLALLVFSFTQKSKHLVEMPV